MPCTVTLPYFRQRRSHQLKVQSLLNVCSPLCLILQRARNNGLDIIKQVSTRRRRLWVSRPPQCGGHIVSQLLKTHAQVSVLDLTLDHNRKHGVQYHKADISAKTDVETVLANVRPQVIIHTASPQALSTDSALYHRINVDGTRILLQCARNIKIVKAFVYTSSASIVHDSVSDLIEADGYFPVLYLPHQKEVYSHTKALAEDLVRAANKTENGMMTVCLRPAAMFGEGDMNTTRRLIENAQSEKYRYQIGIGHNTFD